MASCRLFVAYTYQQTHINSYKLVLIERLLKAINARFVLLFVFYSEVVLMVRWLQNEVSLCSMPFPFQLVCGHVFHLHCCRNILDKRWVGPRITFGFSLCPICKVGHTFQYICQVGY